ncbi:MULTISPECIES: thioredoxin family protein [Arthrospira]|uniref:thioredoxin family protein n=1 Tax=Oscillatoriales TaxID=1150 RepID=UPI0001C38862|nr:MULTISPECIES: thioredoxin family protein [Arthrospira]AMW27599.1 alkyl hydroperoxide reductase [Arthrospira platensis YZ]KDR57896.1 alkyl hydroperoxide reductase [Arthrospira platensis str. Paraca]MBD2668901.1 thioredoxin family protein [Arthrospira platensis FACHB-439]MBD2709337.1 thioredoxin family protein [Arthrospira platensis FACHB-835]MDT9182613.1 thioredoxin family protein [Limnospira sp. PMC 289.06]MDT9294718.1 thioredoxin family protein [Arthrospira platensis PCC 7345]MDT9309705.
MKGTLINSYAPDFELPGVDDEVHHLARYLQKFQVVIVIFMSNSCPYVQSYVGRMKALQTYLQTVGATIVGINANDPLQSPSDSFEQMKIFAQDHDLNFPYIRDVTQDVAHCFGAETTPEAFVLDNQGILRYRGGLDDNPESPEAVTINYLKNAVSQLLASVAIAPETTPPIGSPIQWRR